MLKLERAPVSRLVCRFRSRAVVELENLALRHQLHVLRRQRPGRLRLFSIDRLLWIWLYRLWPRGLEVMVLVKPVTVVQWHRQGFRLFWRWRSRSGRPSVDREVSKLIREMSRSNPLWGAPQSMASCSSSASRSVKLRLPSTWCEEATMTNLTPRVTWTNILSTANVGRYRECRMLSFLLSGSFW